MSFKYLFVRYTKELHNMFRNEQLCLSLLHLLKTKSGKKIFLTEYYRCWYIYCVYPYLYRSQLLGLMLYQSSLWLELINEQLGIFNLFSFFLVYIFFSLSWLLVDYR